MSVTIALTKAQSTFLDLLATGQQNADPPRALVRAGLATRHVTKVGGIWSHITPLGRAWLAANPRRKNK